MDALPATEPATSPRPGSGSARAGDGSGLCRGQRHAAAESASPTVHGVGHVGLPAGRIPDVVLAVYEALANVVEHADPGEPGTLTCTPTGSPSPTADTGDRSPRQGCTAGGCR
ncbi:ATP-binding protein [Amycolatopsis mediterranei]|uniref:ATP-binding protein n=1 Tax=Amycolatopsis mediterranei TaxID=33910 RepID=UPI00342A1FF6